MLDSSDRQSQDENMCASSFTATREFSNPDTSILMESVVERANILTAYHHVKRNKGAAGTDGMSTEELYSYLHENWHRIRRALLEGRYSPQPILSVDIPKPGGGFRTLGIPTVLDRLIQQAIHQVLQRSWEPEFSDKSYGFRPGHSAHDAILQAREYIASGKRWVVDIDLEKFFDRVNHDILMSRIARRVADKRLLRLIRKYLQAGTLSGGVVSPRTEGTPQGGPLSPLLSNILLDELDKELEKRGHSFCRYADDCNIYVKTERSGQRVMKAITQFLRKRLKLKVNQEKSAVARPWERKFLGYSFTLNMSPRLRVSKESVKRIKSVLKKEFRKARGRNIAFTIETINPKLRGWVNYYKRAECKGVFEELDGWIRRRLRCVLWRQWKRPLCRAKNMMKKGLGEERAWKSATNGRGPWWNAGSPHMNQTFPKSLFTQLGLISLHDQYRLYLRSL